MRNFLIILSFIITGICSAVLIGFDLERLTPAAYYDDEQEGLDKQITIRFSHVSAENTPKGRTAEKFAALLEDKTNGTVNVQIYPNALLYNDTNEWEAVQNGNVEMIAPATAKISQYYPVWQILDLPFVFPNYEAVEEAYEGKIGQTLLEEFEHTSIKGLDLWYNGFKQVTNRDFSIRTPNDFNQLHFRSMPGPIIQEQFNQLNVSTSNLPFNKTYKNLEINFIDGQENTLSNINTKKFYEHQQHLTISNHGYLGYGVLINRHFWDGLSDDVQKSINKAMQEATAWGRRHAIEINDKHARLIRANQSLNIYTLSTEERNQWRNKLEPVYKYAEQNISSKLVNKIKEIRDRYSY